MDSLKALSRPTYLVALLLVIIPISDTVISMLPLQLSDESWRFGVVGSISSITLVPLLGALLATSVAVLAEHNRLRRWLGLFSGTIAILLGAVVILFLLDYFQTRSRVQAQLKAEMDVATVIAVVKQILTIVVLTLLAKTGLNGPRPSSRAKVGSSSTPSPSLVRMPSDGKNY